MTKLETLEKPRQAKLTVDDYLMLDEAGAFEAYAKTELIDGRVIAVNATMSAHFMTQTRLLRRLADACDALENGIEAWSEGSVGLPPYNVPQPDLFVTRTLPEPGLVRIENLILVIEVAVTTLKQDMGRKLKLYARSGVPEYWVVDVTGRIIHQMWAPKGATYTERRTVAFGDRIEAATVTGLAVGTAGL